MESHKSVTLHVFTDNKEFFIGAQLPTTFKDRGYLGAMCKARAPLAGEVRRRGSDLPDGKYHKETWDIIVNNIFSHSLLPLEVWFPNQKKRRERAGEAKFIQDKLHGGELCYAQDLGNEWNDLKKWVEETDWQSKRTLFVQREDGTIEVKWYTPSLRIDVVAKLPSEDRPKGYLGATSYARAPYPGEAHCRMSDLADGEFTQETWREIVKCAAKDVIIPLEIPNFKQDV